MGCTAAKPRPAEKGGPFDAGKGAALMALNQQHSSTSSAMTMGATSPLEVGGPRRDTTAAESRESSVGVKELSVRAGTSWAREDFGFKQHLSRVSGFAQLDKQYELGALLGEGITGQVRLVKSRIDGNVYAMKSLNVGKMDESQLAELRAEIEMLKRLDHPNIVTLIEVFEGPNNICLIMEYCSGGDLSDRRFRSENDLASVLNQILVAVAHCHRFGVIHRDLKMENILFVSKDSEHLRLIDFGLSKTFFDQNGTRFPVASQNNLEALNEKKRMMKTVCGTIVYMAPEVLTKSYTEKADVWAIGIIAYTLMTGVPPFSGGDDRETLRQIKMGEISYDDHVWRRVSKAGKQFVQSLLNPDPNTRPSAQEALRLPWLVSFRKRQLEQHPLDANLCKTAFKSLIRFASYPLLRKAALMVISFRTAEVEKLKLQRIFLWLDEECSGELRCEDLYRLIETFGDTSIMPRERFRQVFESIDQDRSGFIHHMEFLAATIESVVKPSGRLLDQAFDHLDADSSGFISAANLMELLGERYTVNDVKEILVEGFKSLDMEPQPQVSREDFLRMMEKVGFPSPFEDVLKWQSTRKLNVDMLEELNHLPSAPPLAKKLSISEALAASSSSSNMILSIQAEPLGAIREEGDRESKQSSVASMDTKSVDSKQSSVTSVEDAVIADDDVKHKSSVKVGGDEAVSTTTMEERKVDSEEKAAS